MVLFVFVRPEAISECSTFLFEFISLVQLPITFCANPTENLRLNSEGSPKLCEMESQKVPIEYSCSHCHKLLKHIQQNCWQNCRNFNRNLEQLLEL